MNEQLKEFVKKTFNLDEADIKSMSDAEYDELYEKAMSQEEILAVRYRNEYNEDLELAADFVDWLYSLHS